jgi:alkanesulfonate monooxygenase SsuD/methylene tetrahydromethanopterin reductase-like flavin-dependent oxidoreductase (luciferase family)
MFYATNMGPYGDHADPRRLATLARDAEEAGWDAFFIWDSMGHAPLALPMPDPWIALAAVALATERLRLGPMITPLPRRRPWKVAREAATLDHLSGGRLILGVGLGDPSEEEFGWYGEETAYTGRAEMLDEGLAILDGLWSGRPFGYQGEHYTLHEVTFLPPPVQRPRIPIWVGGWWPNKRPMRRAARWDGVTPGKLSGPMTPDDVREMVAYVMAHRASQEPFAVCVPGITPGDDPAAGAAHVAAFAEAGATWWIEDCGPERFSSFRDAARPVWPAQEIEHRIRQGPPRGAGR